MLLAFCLPESSVLLDWRALSLKVIEGGTLASNLGVTSDLSAREFSHVWLVCIVTGGQR